MLSQVLPGRVRQVERRRSAATHVQGAARRRRARLSAGARRRDLEAREKERRSEEDEVPSAAWAAEGACAAGGAVGPFARLGAGSDGSRPCSPAPSDYSLSSLDSDALWGDVDWESGGGGGGNGGGGGSGGGGSGGTGELASTSRDSSLPTRSILPLRTDAGVAGGGVQVDQDETGSQAETSSSSNVSYDSDDLWGSL